MKYLKDIIYIILIMVLSTLLILSHLDDNFNILTSSDWVNLVIGIFSATATILLGIIAVYQNKKAHNINDRLLNIEEFNNKTFLYFENAVVPIKLMSDEYWTQSIGRSINETITVEIMDNLDLSKDYYLFVPSCQFFGKFPVNEIIVNGYSMKKINVKTKEIVNEKSSNKKVINNLQCCKENIVYDVNIEIDFDGIDVKSLIDENHSLAITFNITTKNIMGIENNYIIETIFSYVEDEYDNNFFFMMSNIHDSK